MSASREYVVYVLGASIDGPQQPGYDFDAKDSKLFFQPRFRLQWLSRRS